MVWAQNLVKCPYLVFLVTHIGLWVEWNSQFSSMETHEPQKHQPEILWLSLVFRIKFTLDRLEAWIVETAKCASSNGFNQVICLLPCSFNFKDGKKLAQNLVKCPQLALQWLT